MRLPMAVAVLGLLAVPRTSVAQPAAARRVFEAGTEAFRAGRYDTAAVAYEEAYRQAPLPDLAFSAAQAHRRQHFVDYDFARLRRARELYQVYLDQVPEGGRRVDAVTHLQTIEMLLGAAPADESPSPPSAASTRLMVVSRARGRARRSTGTALAPVPLVRDVGPGEHHVRVVAPGYSPADEHWTAVEGHLVVADLEPRELPARLSVRAPRGTALAIDGRLAGTAPLAKALVLAPGRHRLTAALAGHVPVARVVELPRAGSLALGLALRESRQRRLSWWLLGGSAAPLLAGVVTGALAFAADARASDLDAQRDAGTLGPTGAARYEDDLDLRDGLRTSTIVLGAAAVAIGVVGAILYLADAPTPADAVSEPASP